MLPNKVGALFMKMGTGKTRVTVDLVNAVEVDLIIWIGPLRTISPLDESIKPISAEIEKWGGFNSPVHYFGIESIQSSDSVYLHAYKLVKEYKCFLVIDESITIKNMEAKRTKRMLELGSMVEYKLILNGEPVTKNLLDLYSQMQFLSPKILNMGLNEFKNIFCRYTTIKPHKGKKIEFITGYENIDYLYSLIGEYVYECDLELNLQRYFTDLAYIIDEKAKARYYELKERYLTNEMLLLKDNNIFLEMTMKMQHQYCITEAKFECINQWLLNDSAIIFCKYISSAEACKKRYPKCTVLNYHTGAYSYNLQNIPNMIMFDKTFDWGRRAQALARNFRTGSEGEYRVLDLTGDVGLEALINDNNQKKVLTSEYLKMISLKQLKESL